MDFRVERGSVCAIFALAFAASSADAQTSNNAPDGDAGDEPASSAPLHSADAPHERSEELDVDIDAGSASSEIPKPEAVKPVPPSRAVDGDVEKKPVDEPKESGLHQRTLGFAIGGAGVAAIGMGSYFGLQALSKWNRRNDDCKHGCTEVAKSAGDDAKRAALISDIGFGIGIVAVSVGVYLVLSAKPDTEIKSTQPRHAKTRSLQLLPALGPLGAGLLLRGNY